MTPPWRGPLGQVQRDIAETEKLELLRQLHEEREPTRARMEPGIVSCGSEQSLASIAISMRRIADVLAWMREQEEQPDRG